MIVSVVVLLLIVVIVFISFKRMKGAAERAAAQVSVRACVHVCG